MSDKQPGNGRMPAAGVGLPNPTPAEVEEARKRLEESTLPHLNKRRSGSAAARLDAKAIEVLLAAYDAREEALERIVRETHHEKGFLARQINDIAYAALHKDAGR